MHSIALHPLIPQPLSDFVGQDDTVDRASPTYWYEGICPRHHALLRLPRTERAEAIARGLMQQLAQDDRHAQEGKMYGVLLVETSGGVRVLKAFSGLLWGQSVVPGWVPPIPGREQVALAEAQTLTLLEAMKQELITLQQIPARTEYAARSQEFETQLQQLKLYHQQRQQERQQQRQQNASTLKGDALAAAIQQLDDQSRREKSDRRRLKQEQDRQLQPLKQQIDQADVRIRELRQQRKVLSQQLQTQMHQAYRLTNFAGESVSLQQLMAAGALPTGTGDCCAPKLLHYAATQGWKPLAMAEFWWGQPSIKGDKVPSEFYGACVERCQPLMGFLLSGLPQPSTIPAPIDRALPILYEDAWLIAVNKPAGLLSVPGRYLDRQDSVLSRLQNGRSDGTTLTAVHRLDQDTSGILLLARDPQTDRLLKQQFQQRQVHKVYEAVLAGTVAPDHGAIDLPLWGNPANRPRQQVDWQHGKPSLTRFRVINRADNLTRILLEPVTGRTHQLRVHAADPNGLGVPIVGDRLYGCRASADRLHLHAREIHFQHPQSQQPCHLKTATPF